MAVLERPGEERARRRDRLELLPVVAEADDHRPRVERRAAPRAAGGRPCCRAASRSRRRSARRPRGTPRAARRCPRPAAARSRSPGSAGRARASSSEPRERRVARLRARTRRRRRPAAPRARGRRGRRRPPAPRGCARSRRRRRRRAASVSRPQALELRVPAHRVLELRAVRLDREARPRSAPDGRPEQHVVREDEVGRQVLAQRRGVRLDVAVALGLREVLQQPRLEPLVPVEHERPAAARRARAARPPRRRGRTLRMRLLAEDDDVVARAAPLARERPRVDVRAGAAEAGSRARGGSAQRGA